MPLTLTTILQLVVGLGLLNVWLIRSGMATAYRGGDAKTLREEFAAYGLPPWFFLLVGVLKVSSALALIAGIWFPALTLPAAGVVVALMLGALAMHVRVHDPALKSIPASLMLVMSASLTYLALG